MQRSKNIRNSLGSNYKSAALDQLSYAGIKTAHINGRWRVKQVAESDAEMTRRYLKRVQTAHDDERNAMTINPLPK